MTKVVNFARKYRPKNFKECVGDTKAINTIMSTLQSEKRPQVILMRGPAGCGKTTIARLIGKEYCCTNRDTVKGACGECDSCKSFDRFIETGDSVELMNLREYDCSNIGKHEAENIIYDMEAPNLTGGWGVYIFDEAHLLTTQAMGALLKTLEEPVSKRLVILCTTNPERLIDTIVSRCDLQLTVEKQKPQDLMRLLALVCTKEGITYEDKALSVIASRANYEPRTALKLLQTVANSEKEINYNNTIKVLHVTTDDVYYRFLSLCTAKEPEPAKFLKFLAELRSTTDFSAFLDGLIAYVIRGLYVSNGVKLNGLDADEIKTYGMLFKKFSMPEITYILQQFSKAKAKSSADLELLFVLWGYNGLHRELPTTTSTKATETSDTLLKSNTMSENAQMEQNMGVEALQTAKECTPEEAQQMMSEYKAEMNTDDILSMFGDSAVVV